MTFVGDAAMNFLRFTRVGHRPIHLEDLDSVYESWQKLRAHGATTIYPAHGRPFAAGELVVTWRDWWDSFHSAPPTY